ncbi:tail assembly protein [Dickeya dadantii]|uniref:tail assembly protein n=1 Tax=Dickeya dadantii TaxID=204038 RepID=UPI001CF120B1|nr:tail assembly protein [Dickeya dadantii]MCA7012528.1 tail assembly protein [Dickeya dadantii]
MEKLRAVRLYGVLGATFGRVHRLAVETPREAIRALCVLLPGFEAYLNTSKRRGLSYAVFSGKTNIGADELGADHGGSDIRIAPVITGSKQAGLFQTILGVALVAIGYFTFGTTSAIGVGMIMGGASMALGGVIQMLSPQARGLAVSESADNKASYAFGSVKNTAAQGYPVPLLYGKRRIGGAIISAGIYVEDQQ